MSTTRRSSMSPSQASGGDSVKDLKMRVISCLNRLSDRDTMTVATNELESIVRGLNPDSFSQFIACVHATDAGEKSLVRRQCVRLLGLMAETHGDDLSPHLAKMVSVVGRRLKDCDSAVRSACVEAVAVIAARVTKPPFAALFKPLFEVVTVEQDYNLQIGAAMCLAGAIDSAPDPEAAVLAKAVVKMVRLARSECFKAKPALVGLIGSVVAAGGCGSKAVMDSVVACCVEFLSSEDWAARKAAVEVLEKVVVVVVQVNDLEAALEYKKTCVAVLESRRFDKVKVVREAMNQTLKLWREVGSDGEELSPSETQSQSSSRDTVSARWSPSMSPAESSQDSRNGTPKPKKSALPSRSPPSINSSRARNEKLTPAKTSVLKSNVVTPPKFNGHTDWKVEVAIPHSVSPKFAQDDEIQEVASEAVKPVGNDQKVVTNLETKRSLFSRSRRNDDVQKPVGFKSGSRVFPLPVEDNPELTVSDDASIDEACGDNDMEGLSLVRQQLLHIENQQSNLLDLLQRFMGSSQNGMNALESRVQGLEIALDEISHDLAMSNGRMSGSETCCKLPGTEFLSPKFWRRSEGKYLTRMHSPERIKPPPSMQSIPFREDHDQRFQFQPQDFRNNTWGDTDPSNRVQNFNQGGQRLQTASNARKFGGSSHDSGRTTLYT